MKCNIEYVGKMRNGKEQYFCTTHQSIALDSNGNKLEECLCNTKEIYDNILDIKGLDINSIEIIYENVLDNLTPIIYINNKVFKGVLKYNDCIINYKDFNGIMLSKLNNIPLELVKCSHCNHYHTDNGKFAYTPHRTHLCLYCGHLFRVKKQNIGNELAIIFNIPNIELNNNKISINDKCNIKYNLLKGEILINNQNINTIKLNNKEMGVIEFINGIFKNEF